MARRKHILIFGLAVGLIFGLLFVAKTYFGPQTRAEQTAELRATAEQRMKKGDVDGALWNLKQAIQLDPNDEEAKRRYDEIDRSRSSPRRQEDAKAPRE